MTGGVAQTANHLRAAIKLYRSEALPGSSKPLFSNAETVGKKKAVATRHSTPGNGLCTCRPEFPATREQQRLLSYAGCCKRFLNL
jgi:hypothetical protein